MSLRVSNRLIRIVALDVVLDLAAPGFGHRDGPAILAAIRADTRPMAARGVACHGIPKGETARCGEPMYVRHLPGGYIGVHQKNGAKQCTAPETAEHRAMKDLACDLLARAGFPVDQEVRRVGGGRVYDVLAQTDVGPLAVEPTVANTAMGSATRKLSTDHADGILTNHVLHGQAASLAGRLPYTRINALTAEVLRTQRAKGLATPAPGGLYDLELERCVPGMSPCPDRGRGYCGRTHRLIGDRPQLAPTSLRHHLVGIASGEFVVASWPWSVRGVHHGWVRPGGLARALDAGVAILAGSGAGPGAPRSEGAYAGAATCRSKPEAVWGDADEPGGKPVQSLNRFPLPEGRRVVEDCRSWRRSADPRRCAVCGKALPGPVYLCSRICADAWDGAA